MKNLVLAGALAALASLSAAQDIGMKEHAGLSFACGGAGVEEREALAALRPKANIELLFVTAKRGGYLADVELSVYATDKQSPAFKVTAEGPICLISAPAGNYRIEASYGEARRSHQMAATAKHSRVVFGFPDEPWDGIKASEEEKQSGRTP